MKRSLETMLFALTAAAAVIVTTDDAKAAINAATINNQGDLELEFRESAPRNRSFEYTARATATTTFACSNALFIKETLTNVVTRPGIFTSDFAGWVNALLTLNLPGGQSSLNCPFPGNPVITRVEYRQIEIRGELGDFNYGRDVIKNF
jgi:hypothetical protein